MAKPKSRDMTLLQIHIRRALKKELKQAAESADLSLADLVRAVLKKWSEDRAGQRMGEIADFLRPSGKRAAEAGE